MLEVQKRLLHQRRDLGAAQPAGAVASIESRLHSFAHFGGSLCFRQADQLHAPPSQDHFWKAIGQSKGDVLGHFPGFKVGQMGSMVLAGGSDLSNLVGLLHDW